MNRPEDSAGLADRLFRLDRHLRAIRTRTLILVLIAGLGAAYFARDFVLPLVLAFLLALTLSPIVRHLQRRNVPAGVTALVLVAALLAVFAGGIFFLSGPFSHWVDMAPAMGQELSKKLANLRSPVEAAVQASNQVENLAASASASNVQKVVLEQPGLLSRAADTLVSTLTTVGVMLVLLLFLLSSGTLFYEKMVAVLPTLTDKKRALRVAYDVEREVSRYLFTVTLINICLGVAVTFAMAFLGMPNPPLWGVAATLLNFIPFIGPIAGIAIVSVVAILSFDTIGQAIIPPLAYVGCHILESQFLTPIILGRRLELNSVAIFISIALWSWLWGIVGAIIAVPLLVTIKVICDHFDGLASFGEFLSSGAPSRAEELETAEPANRGPTAV